MTRYNKGGIAPVIATILLVLLTLGAISILAGFVIPFVRDNLQKGTECVPYRGYFSFEDSLGYTCFDSAGKNGFTVKAGTATKEVSDKVIGFDVVFIAGGEGKKASAREDNSASELKMLNSSESIKIPQSGEIRTYVYNVGKKYDSVEIYPVLASEAVCEKSDSIKLVLCGQEVSLS